MTSSITPFQISIPDSKLISLKAKLLGSSFPEEVALNSDWEYGVPVADMKRLAAYWRDGFDWRAQEKKLNELPQFKTSIEVDGFGELDIHFVHQKGREGSVPLLFCHGWPGSFIEVKKILKMLTETSGDLSFHVVAPSLPNFGFSGEPKKAGFGISQYSECIHKLMLKLGYNQYVSQGGDWGWSITRSLGFKYPAHCVASHLNSVEISSSGLEKCLQNLPAPLTKQEEEGIARTKWFINDGYGYNSLQSTKPATIGFAIQDSPVALLSWIYEKLHDWTDAYPWTDDEILTWVSIFQFSAAGPGASLRIYYECMHAPWEGQNEKVYEYIGDVKLGLSIFPKDLSVPPSCYSKGLGDVVFEKRHVDGGHFAAYERPEKLVEDLREMFGQRGGAEKLGKKIAV